MSRPRDRQGRSRPERRPGPPARRAGPAAERELLFGLHAVQAALNNPRRRCYRLIVTGNAAHRLGEVARQGLIVERAGAADLDRRLGADVVHQGAALECAPLEQPELDEMAGKRLLLVLDQVTDPHNFGAILRSAAAFGVDALVTTGRHSPSLTGTVAKAASGGLEHVALVTVPNLARALDRLGELGFERVGLDGAAALRLDRQDVRPPVALVLGAEGKGLRRLTREHCDRLCRLATTGTLASLNVSNAAAIALHEITTSPAWPGAAD